VATAIEISGVTRRFGSTVAIDGLSLDVAAGEIFALVGPDGAGKTTLIRLICGALSLDAGELRVDGQDVVRQTSRVQSTIGYMPQRFSLYPDLSVMENLRFYGDIFGVTRADFGPRAQSLLNEFALAPFGERLAEELSGGMKQKLALACTLIHSPATILLDEPTAGVDPVSRREFLAYSLPYQSRRNDDLHQHTVYGRSRARESRRLHHSWLDRELRDAARPERSSGGRCHRDRVPQTG
jgi:ABC-2 type transport system ATP-binding protein